MRPVIDNDFLLHSDAAKALYHQYAEKMPIIDYHCHIDPQDIAEDRIYDNITQVWLGGDHYKWRLMRANGVSEEYVTGGAPDREKFQKFAAVMPKAAGNPVYHWVHLELKRYFGYEGELNEDTAEQVWQLCNERLKTLSVRKMIARYHVKVIATTDDPADALTAHEQIAADPDCKVKVIPAWRPDKVLNIHKEGAAAYLGKLSQAAGVEITGLDSLFAALSRRMDFFASHGCCASDHGLERTPCPAAKAEAEAVLTRVLRGEEVSREDAAQFQYVVMRFLAGEYHSRNWVMQLHMCATYGVNTFQQKKLGPDTGFDCIGSSCNVEHLAHLLTGLSADDALGKTILYSLNPNDLDLLAVLTGSFQQAGLAGKIQLGAAWWFNDTYSGIRAQLTAVANNSLLGNFIGMLTDSRSFLSYARHEYFRRILCDMVGGWMEQGMLSDNLKTWGRLVEDVSYHNVQRYFFQQ